MTPAVSSTMESTLAQNVRCRPSHDTSTPMLLLWEPLTSTPTSRKSSTHLVSRTTCTYVLVQLYAVILYSMPPYENHTSSARCGAFRQNTDSNPFSVTATIVCSH